MWLAKFEGTNANYNSKAKFSFPAEAYFLLKTSLAIQFPIIHSI